MLFNVLHWAQYCHGANYQSEHSYKKNLHHFLRGYVQRFQAFYMWRASCYWCLTFVVVNAFWYNWEFFPQEYLQSLLFSSLLTVNVCFESALQWFGNGTWHRYIRSLYIFLSASCEPTRHAWSFDWPFRISYSLVICLLLSSLEPLCFNSFTRFCMGAMMKDTSPTLFDRPKGTIVFVNEDASQ